MFEDNKVIGWNTLKMFITKNTIEITTVGIPKALNKGV